MTVTRDEVLNEIRRTAEANGGRPLGRSTFFTQTGIKESDWKGRYWARWNEALKDAGFGPNKLNESIDEAVLLSKYAELALELERLPVNSELRLKRRSDSSFPSDGTYERFGGKKQLLSRLKEHCIAHPNFVALMPLIDASLGNGETEKSGTAPFETQDGFVYLAKMGKHYKIGKTFSVPRRHRELAIELPEKLKPIHSIRTDDPTGIEAYWHKRFQAKCTNGEWFALSADDVKAFKKRRFM